MFFNCEKFVIIRINSCSSSDFPRPLAVTLEVEANSLVAVVGVDFGGGSPVGVVERSLRLVQSAAASYVLAIASAPLGSGFEVGEVAEVAIVGDGYHGLAAASGGVCTSVLVAMKVEISPALCGSPLCSFAHVVAPVLALVGGGVTFEELPRQPVSARPLRGQ